MTPDGGLVLAIDLRVSLDEMRDWSPDRISRLFAGIAMVQAAANPPPSTLVVNASVSTHVLCVHGKSPCEACGTITVQKWG